jgi:hypothetical protein
LGVEDFVADADAEPVAVEVAEEPALADAEPVELAEVVALADAEDVEPEPPDVVKDLSCSMAWKIAFASEEGSTRYR